MKSYVTNAVPFASGLRLRQNDKHTRPVLVGSVDAGSKAPGG
jgi:hypothetical protein